MKASPVQLIDSVVMGFSFEVDPASAGIEHENPPTMFDGVAFDLTTGFDPLPAEIQQAGNRYFTERDFVVWMRIGTSAEQPRAKLPASFRAHVKGVVRVHPGVPEPDVHRLAAANGLALLYGIVRELVTGASARGPISRMVLPTVNFLDDADALVEQFKGRTGLAT